MKYSSFVIVGMFGGMVGGMIGLITDHSYQYFLRHHTIIKNYTNDTNNTHIISQQDYLILNEVKQRFKCRDNMDKKHGMKIEAVLVKFFSNIPRPNEVDTEFDAADMFYDCVNWHRVYGFDFDDYKFAKHDPHGVAILEAYLENAVRKKMEIFGLKCHHYEIRTYIDGCIGPRSTGNSKKLSVNACVFLSPYFYRDQRELNEKIKSVIESKKIKPIAENETIESVVKN